MRPILSMTGFLLLLLPLLLSKSKLLRFFFKMKCFLLLSQLSLGIYLWYPIICLAFYFSQNTFTQISFLSICYYAAASFVLAVAIAYLFFLMIEGPLKSLSSIYDESREIREGSKTFKFRFLEINDTLMPEIQSR